jgi:hypothetical protein
MEITGHEAETKGKLLHNLPTTAPQPVIRPGGNVQELWLSVRFFDNQGAYTFS